VTLVVEGDGATGDGTGPVIEEKLQQLKREPAVPLLPEIPDDYTTIPPDWLALVSWNIQTGGTSTSAGAARPPMVKTALSNMFSGTYQILAAQEISNADSAGILRGLLPGASGTWESAFFDSSDSMDNGFWHRTGVTIRDAFPLFVTGQMDSAGRLVPDLSRTTHPPAVAHFEIGDIDFTLINVHLTFADGDTTQTANEMRHVLDYLDWYFNQPDHDPDVIVCGDFNIPSALSGQTGRNGMTLDAMFDQDARFQVGERRFVVTIHEPTSRSSSVNGGVPANNYDHCVLSADMMEEFVQARRLTTAILTSHPDDPEQRLTSDHFPVVAFFRTRGEGVALDSSRISVRPPWSDLRSAALQFERRILSVPLAAGPERKKSSGAFRWRALDGRIEP
jgi:endonuclease/exonuclease/phosphatase family metal-dependent hydrolase